MSIFFFHLSFFEEFSLFGFHAGLLISNFENGQRVNIHFVPNLSLRSLFPKIWAYPVALDVQERTAASGHYVVTEQPLIINCEKYPTLCLNINRWTYTVRSAIPLSLSQWSLMSWRWDKVTFPLACNECWAQKNSLIRFCLVH